MTNADVFLVFAGECEAAFNFYQSVIGGTFSHVSRFSDMPNPGENPVPENEKNKILHIGLQLHGNSAITGSDGGLKMPGFKAGNNFAVVLNTGSRKEADHVFAGLSEGGKVRMPLADTFWGSYFGMVTDKFGITWQINFLK